MKHLIKISLLIFISVQIFPQTDSTISYHENNKISSIIKFNDGVRDGDARFYWNNGNIKEELTYVNGKVEGLVRRYYQNGNLKEMFSIENGKREGPTSLFDSTGKYVDDIFYEEGILVVDKIKLDDGKYHKLLSNNQSTEINKEKKKKKKKVNPNDPLPPVEENIHNYEDDPAFYSKVEVMPEPIGGMEAIYKKIGYPKEARENGIEGTVKILAFIDRDGEVIDAQVVEGIGYGCDETARLAVFYHRFKPGMQRGQRVKIQMDILIDFKLDKFGSSVN